MPWSFVLPQAITTSPLLAVATPITIGTASALLTNRKKTNETYGQLRQPPLHPPAWLFGPAWTLLYGLMGYASHHATVTASQSLSHAVHAANRSAQTLYTTQLALNFLWMPLFFGLGRPAAALGDMTLLMGNVTLLLANWWDADRTAFWLMTPYYVWLGYAAYLNAGVGWLNGWTLPKKHPRSE
ncbi:TspO/MBR-related protein [Penicillium canariense]|uniref:TspO/MBR-related protein n=1 Tax=Penicillium canariense TaxID=189055 RepID=A0A9W9HMB0_9EURO|nr:TspO/MBR-related protein [Penicillium canariense]KAJ5151300.1 TspO/MBR-related protein [Penicillium canariense]